MSEVWSDCIDEGRGALHGAVISLGSPLDQFWNPQYYDDWSPRLRSHFASNDLLIRAGFVTPGLYVFGYGVD